MRVRGIGDSLCRGINLGNALDVDRGQHPRLPVEARHLHEVWEAGFDFVRLPVRWSAYAEESSPYTIDAGFFEMVDRVIGDALGRGLTVILNVHHYDELQQAPHKHAARLVALWRQISARYAAYSLGLYFELLNEPRDALSATIWNALLSEALAAVRESNRDRIVIVGSAPMNAVDALQHLVLPDDDHLLATIHYYSPLEFTHQGAPWLQGADRWLGTAWGNKADRDAVRRDLSRAAEWARTHHLPLLVGEFGTYEKADLASRLRWTTFVWCEAERLNLSWCYWDFGTDFGAFDPQQNAWREPILATLLP